LELLCHGWVLHELEVLLCLSTCQAGFVAA
jgi:hypothetical protein